MPRKKSPPKDIQREHHAEVRPSEKSLVFISHDTRDAEIAEALSKLLSSVSAGVLKSFRSSDKKGKQGIEYGVDWYPEIMKRLDEASAVVCLLTPYSVNRPWLLYEAGVAKGQLNTPVHGLALGIPLREAGTGPFAQFQNCDDDIESIASLVMQLVATIPNAEPDRDVVLIQVEAFKTKVASLIEKQGHEKEKPKKVDDTSVAKLFEEIKLMYQDLPSRVESQVAESPHRRRKFRRFHPEMFDYVIDGDAQSSCLGLLMWLGLYREETPWLYDLAYQLYNAIEDCDRQRAERVGSMLAKSAHLMRRGPLSEAFRESKEFYLLSHELPHIVERLLSRLPPPMEKSRKRSGLSSTEEANR